MSKNGKGSVYSIRFIAVFIKTFIALIIIRFINWHFVVTVTTGTHIRTLKVTVLLTFARHEFKYLRNEK